jgi:uncharacterized protein
MPTEHRGGVSRRGFHRRVFSAALGTAAAGCATAAVAAAAKPRSGGKYVDMHVHLTQDWVDKPPALTVKMLLDWMDQHQIAQAVVLPLVSPEAWYYLISNEWVFEQTKPYRDRLIPFCDIDPRTVYLKPPAILALLKRYIAAGAKGFGEHKCGTAIDDPRNLAVFRACSELHLPVLLHMDTIRNTDAPGLPGLERVLREAPHATFIGHATAWWSSISADVTEKQIGGYPKGPVKPGGAMERLMDKYPNIYGELSAGSGLNAIQRDPDFGREFLIRRADRVMFGTDYLADGQKVEQFEFLDKLDLPADVQAKIFRDNARRVLGLGAGAK